MLIKLYITFVLFFSIKLSSTQNIKCSNLALYCKCEKLKNEIVSEKFFNFKDITKFILISCENIENPTNFLSNLSLTISKSTSDYILKINDTKHEKIEQILSNLNVYSIKKLNGLILSNITDVKDNIMNFDLLSLINLEHLAFIHNDFDHLDCTRFNLKLKTIFISENSLKSIYGCNLLGDFLNLTYLDLSKNNLNYFKIDDQINLNETKIVQIDLTNNNWHCDTGLLPIINLVDLNEGKEIFIDELSIKCNTPKKIANLNFKQVSDILKTEICYKCDCYVIRGQNLGLNCEKRGLLKMPNKLPLNTKVVNLDHNFIKNLSLDVKQKGWSDVIYLSVSHNNITSLTGLESKFLRKILSLNLIHNSLTTIPIETLNKMTSLQVLNLGYNPWTCDCNTEVFQRWLRNKDVKDLESVKCDNREDSLPIYKLNSDDLCPKTNLTLYWDIANISLSISIIFLAFKLLYDYIWKLKTGKLPYFFKINC